MDPQGINLSKDLIEKSLKYFTREKDDEEQAQLKSDMNLS